MSDDPTPAADRPSPAAPDAFDLARAMERFGNDHELLVEMVEVFFNDAPAMMEQIRRAVADRDFSTIARGVHSLRGTVAYYGVESFAAVTRRLEQAAGQGRPESMPADLARLEVELSALAAALTPFRVPPGPAARLQNPRRRYNTPIRIPRLSRGHAQKRKGHG